MCHCVADSESFPAAITVSVCPASENGEMPNSSSIRSSELVQSAGGQLRIVTGLVHDVNLFRQTSDYICPSRFWVETEEEKGRLLGDYRRNLGQKECKYFNKVGYWH